MCALPLLERVALTGDPLTKRRSSNTTGRRPPYPSKRLLPDQPSPLHISSTAAP
jgi:hypothetical protein